MNRHYVFFAALCLAVALIPLSMIDADGQNPGNNSPAYDTLWVNKAVERVIQSLGDSRIEEALERVQIYGDSASVRYGIRSRERADILELEVTLCDYWGVTPGLLEKADLCLKIREEQFGKRHIKYASALIVLVHARSYTGLYEDDQIPLLKEALDILGNPSWVQSDERLNALNQISLIYQQRGESVKAEAPLLEALSLEQELYGEERYEYSSLCGNMGNVYLSLGRLSESIRYLEISLEKTELLTGPVHPDYCSTLMNLGIARMRIGLFEESERSLLEALDIAGRVFGAEHQNLAPYHWALADYYGKTGYYERMHIHVDAGFNLATAQNTLPSLMAILAYKQRGIYKEHTGDYEGAREQYSTLLRALESGGLSESIQYADVMLRLGRVHRAEGDMTTAYDLTNRAVAIADSLYTPDNPTFFMLYSQHLLSYLDTPEQIEHCYRISQQGMGVIHRYYGEESLNMAIWGHYTGRIYAERGQPDSALIQYRDVYSILGNRIRDGLTFMTFEQQEAYLGAFDVFFNNILSLGLKYPSDTAVCSFLYDAALFRKELLGFSHARALSLWRNSADPVTDILQDRYMELRQRAIAIESWPVVQQDDLSDLKAEIETVERQLIGRTGYTCKSVLPNSGSWTEIKRALMPGEAAIEYLVISDLNKKSRFAALVLRHDSSSPELILLGEAVEVNQYIQNTDGRAFSYAERVYGTGESALRISGLIWKPLDSHLKGIRKVFLAPAGGLYQLNFRALRTESAGIRLGDRLNLVCLTSTRQLLDESFRHSAALAGREALLTGGVDFDEISDKDAGDEHTSSGPAAPSPFRESGAIPGAEDRGSIKKRWEALPETMREVQSIDSMLREKKFSTTLITGRDAAEATFKKSGGKPWSVVHIASHGFFYEKQGGRDLSGLPGFVTSSNPMLRSGLLFAGANRVWSGTRSADNWNDGILTAEEVSLMNLGGVELVTLSACETGLGEIRNYEGIFGFQRAFRLAGVRNLVMTLWRVPDNTTRLFMLEFYSNIARDYPVRAAFEAAVRNFRKKYPAPYYWAGYVLVDGER